MPFNLYKTILEIEFTFFFSTVTSVASKTEPFPLEGSLVVSLKRAIHILGERNEHAYTY